MPRTRRTPTKNTQASKAAAGSSGELVCPECGKTFTRAASLGAHRNRTHGVTGAKTARRSRPSRRTTTTANSTRTTRRRTQTASASDGSINRDALLQTLFPNGVPARESVIRNVHAWLDEAERLARSR